MEIKNLDKKTVFELETIRNELKDNLEAIYNELALRIFNQMSMTEIDNFLRENDELLNEVAKGEPKVQK